MPSMSYDISYPGLRYDKCHYRGHMLHLWEKKKLPSFQEFRNNYSSCHTNCQWFPPPVLFCALCKWPKSRAGRARRILPCIPKACPTREHLMCGPYSHLFSSEPSRHGDPSIINTPEWVLPTWRRTSCSCRLSSHESNVALFLQGGAEYFCEEVYVFCHCVSRSEFLVRS